MKAEFIRIFADAHGDSHFEEIVEELFPVDFAPATPPLYTSAASNSGQVAFLAAPAGWESDWHVSSSRNFFVVVSGEWEIETSDGSVRRFGPNTVMRVEDTTGKGHRSRVVSAGESLMIVVKLDT